MTPAGVRGITKKLTEKKGLSVLGRDDTGRLVLIGGPDKINQVTNLFGHSQEFLPNLL